MTIILFTLMITAVASTYMIGYSHNLFLIFERIAKKIGIKDVTITAKGQPETGEKEKEMSV